MIRLIVICDECSAVGPHVDTESVDRAVTPLLDKAGGEGWRFGTFGLRCKACARENYRAYREAKQAGLRALS